MVWDFMVSDWAMAGNVLMRVRESLSEYVLATMRVGVDGSGLLTGDGATSKP
jgi:hypothetical protein